MAANTGTTGTKAIKGGRLNSFGIFISDEVAAEAAELEIEDVLAASDKDEAEADAAEKKDAAPCPECLKPCPEHNVTFCLTCHNHPGECEMGGCTKTAKGGKTFDFSGMERRSFCRKHSTHPHFGWLRAGGTVVEQS